MAAKRLIRAEDLYQIKTVEEPQWSPDGQWVAFVRMEMDSRENKYRRSIWLWSKKSGEARQFTSGSGQDRRPRFSPDGSQLAFVSTRNGKPQIYLIRLDGGEARPVTHMPNGASNPAWSPDGRRLAFTSAVNREERRLEERGEFPPPPPEDELEAEVRKLEKEHREKQSSDPSVFEGLPIRAGTDYLTDRYAHVYVVDVAEEEAKPRRLTEGDADSGAPEWSPDGRYLWSAAARRPTQERYTHFDLVRINAKSGEAEKFTRPGFNTSSPKPSPDGKWLACISTLEKYGFGHITRLTVMRPNGTGYRDLNLEFDRSVGLVSLAYQFHWSADSSGLYFTAGDRGDTSVYYITVVDGEVKRVVGGRREVLEIAVNKENEVAFTATTPERPADLYVTGKNGRASKRQTDFNAKLLDEVRVAPTEELRYKAPDGTPIQGWIVKPPDFKPTKQWPLAVNVHGGPHVMWGPSTPSMWIEWQLHAARGYVVFYCNPRGSDGYGDDFRTANRNNWGESDMADILSGVDKVVEQGYVDPKRMALTGGSYGGFMTAWIVGHDRRFACAVSQRGVYHLVSFDGTTDIHRFIEGEFETFAFREPERMWRYSPLAYAENIRTPLLILHSDRDFRVPIADAEQLFSALKRLGRKVQFVRYPRDGHELSRSGEPRHRVDRLNRMVDWFDKYCRGKK